MLAALGGLEIAAIVGAVHECARRRIPVLVDGFICTAACALAARVPLASLPPVSDGGSAASGAGSSEAVRACLFPATRSAEGAAAAMNAALACGPPALDMGLRLGEGTGAVLAVGLLRGAAAVARDMLSLDAAMGLMATPAHDTTGETAAVAEGNGGISNTVPG